MKKQLIKIAKQIKGFFPTKLPVGMTQFNAWVDEFFVTYNLPTKSRSDIIHILGSEVIRLNPGVYRKPNRYFYNIIVSAAAKQIAGAAFHENKERQMAEMKKAQEEALAKTTKEATQSNEGASSVDPKSLL